MLELLGEHYYLNLENIDKFVNVPQPEPISGETTDEKIAIVRYEMVKLLTDVIMTENEDVDDKLGSKSANNLTIPFKLAWNTMLLNKFIEKF